MHVCQMALIDGKSYLFCVIFQLDPSKNEFVTPSL